MNFKKEDIQGIILRDFSWVPNLKNKVFIVDNEYISLSKTYILNSIKYDDWLKREVSYKQEVFDCDDYAMYLKCKITKMFVNNNQNLPGALGFIITSNHAFNFSINNKTEIDIYDTVARNIETSQDNFRYFLDFKPGNTVKLIYI